MIIVRSIALAGVLVAVAGAGAHAATYQVTNFQDAIPAPAGSFRAALEAAVATPLTNGSPHRIEFNMAGTGTIYPVAPFGTYRSIRVFGNDKVTFDSSTAASAAVDGRTLFEVPSKVQFELMRAVVTGRVRQRAFYVGSAAVLETSLVRINGFGRPEDHEAGYGGAVLCDAQDPGPSLSYRTGCYFRSTTIQNSQANWGGAVAAIGMVSLSFSNSDLSYNTAWEEGGAVLFWGFGPDPLSWLNVRRTTMRNNSAWREGGAIETVGVTNVYIVNSTITFGYSYTADSPSVYIDDVDDLRILNTTIANGHPSANGDGAELSLFRANGYVYNSVLGQSGSAFGRVCLLGPGNSVAFAHNVIQDVSCGTPATASLGLQPLATVACNLAPPGVGGCKMHALSSTSPAIGAADNGFCTAGHGTNDDQRQYLRDSDCDAGSYERNATP